MLTQQNRNKNISSIQYVLLAAAFIFILMSIPINAQNLIDENAIKDFENSRRHINQTGMIVLGSWALANIAAGTIGHFNSTGESKYFWQFNAMWNTVNLGIAALGYFGNAPLAASEQITLNESLKEYSSLQNILLLNAGLDVAYIATGFLLREKSKTSNKNSERLKGYGNSLILQGGFLLAFDVALYLTNLNNADLYLYPLIGSIAEREIGLVFQLKL